MTEPEKNILLIRIDERVRTLRDDMDKIVLQVETLNLWKSEIKASIKTTAVIWGIIGSMVGMAAGAATVYLAFIS